MRKQSAKRRLISLFTIILLSSLYLQAAYAAPAMRINPEVNRDLSIISHKILLLEHEIRTIRKQQERIENLSHEISKIEQSLKTLQDYVKQNTRQEKFHYLTDTPDPEKSKVNFFVPAGW